MEKHKLKAKIFLYNTFGFLFRFPLSLYLLRKVFIKEFGGVNSIAFHITGKCNLDCIYCNQRNPKDNDMGFQEFCRLVDEAKKTGIREITLAGGEPFVHSQIFEMLNYCKSKNMKVSIYTNGTLIGEDTATRLAMIKGLSLVFKFDSPFSYEGHVGSDVYKKVSDTITLCTSKGIKSVARINVTKKNIKHLSDIIKKSFELGAAPVIERHMPLKNDAINQKLELNADEWQEALKTYYEHYAGHIKVSAKSFLTYKKNQARLLGYKCFGFNSTLVIRANGDVVPCGLALDELSVGNINREPLSATLKKYYKQREEWRKIPEECKSCNEAETCRGGCKAYTYLKLKCFDKKDPLCKTRFCNQEPIMP
ncbi:MAG: radical SAM protein [Nanoarchaeota archaeon]|nr:radical SAM protein [Nanoarchaeota archaeon]